MRNKQPKTEKIQYAFEAGSRAFKNGGTCPFRRLFLREAWFAGFRTAAAS